MPPFLEALLQVGVDRMMFSADHPHQSVTEATTFLAGLPLTPHDRERIARGKGERVLNIRTSTHLTLPQSTPDSASSCSGVG